MAGNDQKYKKSTNCMFKRMDIKGFSGDYWSLHWNRSFVL